MESPPPPLCLPCAAAALPSAVLTTIHRYGDNDQRWTGVMITLYPVCTVVEMPRHEGKSDMCVGACACVCVCVCMPHSCVYGVQRALMYS